MKNIKSMHLMLFVLAFSVMSCGQNFTADAIHQSAPSYPSENQPGYSKVIGIGREDISASSQNMIQIQGLNQAQPVLLTIKDSQNNIRGVVEANYNSKVSLSSLSLNPGEEYTVIAESAGYKSSVPQTFIASEREVVSPIVFEKIEDNIFHYHWETNFFAKEYEYTSHVPVKSEIIFEDQVIDTPMTELAQKLKKEKNLILSNEKMKWTYSYVNRLAKIINTIPHNELEPTKVELTKEFLTNDLHVEEHTLTLSAHIFNNATPRMGRLNGVKGKFFSHKLYHALVRFITNEGEDRDAVEKILDEKFGITTEISNIERLTGEDAANFQDFHNEELLSILTAFAEMPEGFHKIDGLRYLVRRLDGHPHPLYPQAPAVAWPRGADSDSYIEFMDIAFVNYGASQAGGLQSDDYIHRLVVHEKTHFIWRNLLSDELREEWIEIAGWYRNANDPDGWSNKYTTSFVSSYAHKKNPNEDLAETVSYYIFNPNKVKNVAPAKFDFIQERLMGGDQYIAQVREDLQFEVLNLFPNYDYPGKIKAVTVKAIGHKNQDKRVIIDVKLLNKAQFNDSADYASMRITSEADTFVDMYLYPVNGNGHHLRGEVIIPVNAKQGYWSTDQINIVDEAGNKRMEGMNDFGFSLFINNANEDITPPKYVRNSLDIDVQKTYLQGRAVHKVIVEWDIDEDVKMKARNGVYVNFISLDRPESYAIQKYGNVDLSINRAHVEFYVTEYFPKGRYTVAYLNMKDAALNFGTQFFSNDPLHEKQKVVQIETTNHDSIKPVLDVNRLTVEAKPVNINNPDGQTEVKITYYAKDDKSGLGNVSYRLVGPTGKTYHGYHYHSNFYTNFFKGEPTVYKKYVIHHTLPRGSAPGTWGLQEMNLSDKGGNSKNFNFLEVLRFEVD